MTFDGAQRPGFYRLGNTLKTSPKQFPKPIHSSQQPDILDVLFPFNQPLEKEKTPQDPAAVLLPGLSGELARFLDCNSNVVLDMVLGSFGSGSVSGLALSTAFSGQQIIS